MHTESSVAESSRRMSTDADSGDCPTALTMSMATTPPCRFQQQLRIQHRRAHNRRQGAGTGNVAEGYPACNAVDQAVLSCYPQSNTSVPQDEYSKFIWNPNIPQNIGRGSVDIYVFNAGSEESVQSWRNIPNDRGSIGFQVNEGWFPSRSAWSDGQTATNSYYFVVATAGTREERLGSLPHQATFVALQTNPPASLVASLSSAATAQAVPTAAAGQTTASNAPTPTSPDDVAASLSAAGLVPISTDAAGQTYYTTGSGYRGAPALTSGGRLASTPTVTPTLPPGILTQPQSTNTSRNPSSLQNGNGDGNSIPAWAIALIAVFGAIALLAGLIGLWFCLRRTRRKRRRESRFLASGPASGRDSVANADGTAREVQSPSQQALMSERQHADRPLSGQTDNTSSAPYSAIGSAGTRSSMQATSALLGDSPAAASSNIGGSAALAGAAGVAGFAAGRRSETPRSASSGYAGDSPTPHRTMSPQGRPAGGVHQKPSQHSLASSSAIAPTDAAIIGDAFRKILRKPEFPQNDSGSSGEHDNSGTNTPRQYRASMIDAAGEVSSRHERRRTRASSFGLGALRGTTPRPGSPDEFAAAGETSYGSRESDEEDGSQEVDELMRSELASEQRSVKSIAQRKKPVIQNIERPE